MAATSADVTRIYPGASGDTRISAFLTVAGRLVSAGMFGVNYDEAVAAMTAHLLQSLPATGSGQTLGPITSESFVDRSVGYGSPISGSDEYAQLARTTGGAYYLFLLRSRPKSGARLLL